MSLFGSSSTTAKPLFGAATTSATTGATGGLFGSTTTSTGTAPSGGLFGAKPAATGGLFGSTTTAPAAATAPVSGGLFGAQATTTAAAPSLFSSTTTPAATSTVPLFGSTTAAATPSTAAAPAGGLFGAKPATTTTTGGLFGSTAPATTTPATGLTLGTTSTASPAPGGLFGAKPATTGGLFGSTATTSAPATGLTLGASAVSSSAGGLFGAKPTTTATSTGGLFGSTTSTTATSTPFGSTAPANTTLGLGGVQQNTTVASASGAVASSLTGTDKDATKDGEMQAAGFIRDMLPLIEEKLRKNRELIEEVENLNVPTDSVSIDEMIDKTRGWISEVRRNVRSATDASATVAQLAANDKALLDTAKRVQDQSAHANQAAHAQYIKKHLADRTQVYDLEMQALQSRVTDLRNKFEKLLKGEPSLSMSEVDQYFNRVDLSAGAAQHHIQQLGVDIESVRNQLIEQGYTQLRRNAPNYNVNVSCVTEGAEFFPSQSSLAIIGSSLRAPAAAPAGGLGLGTGSSLFGSNTGGTSLFGSTAAAKPAFSGGSLFGNLSSTPASTSTSLATTTPSTSLFGAKPAAASTTTFASTVSNNSSGLLFSSKK